ncbi:MAG: DUF2334 domain-containing protein, partial [Candidatus Atribacteria bacterium]|nr:DUF2334 domain-containing protein [Candidatus Atribacteria bacterium]
MKKRIILILFFILSNFVFAQDSLFFCIRVDDILSRNMTYLPRSIFHFQDTVAVRGGKVTWAVIPHRLIESQNEDSVLALELVQSVANGHEISLHGYNHICTKCNIEPWGHEMFCPNTGPLTLSEQNTLIQNGLQVLDEQIGITPTSFVPPGHYNDTNTFNALLEKNFNLVSTTGIADGYIHKELFQIQRDAEFTWALNSAQYQSQLNAALTDIENKFNSKGYYVILHHDYFIRQGYENGIVINWMGELLDSLNNRYGSKIQYVTLTELMEHLKSKIPTTIENSIAKVEEYMLFQNYPNPFNPSTTIRFSTPPQPSPYQGEEVREGFLVTLKVFDMLGQEVAILVNGKKSPGIYEVKFDGRNLPSGIYFYKLNVGNFTQTK